ncbi:MAG: fibrillarin-like rRNA/tRNA 2'-O-methyltransferase [Candidatus Thorarchaeota archaeon]|nr:MAG: fibrillarin-like rRNA/tRNA 2'-O-methyltransferase [Candidatus Thorarchaeota archaeon]
MTSIQPHKFSGIFNVVEDNRYWLSTRSLVPNQSVYGERIVKSDDGDYRIWTPRRSKLAAAIQKGMKEMPIQPGSRVLYLGASTGTTVSHVSDIVGPTGIVYAVEFSPRVARGLLRLSETRSNIVPIVEDARHPDRYAAFVAGTIDVVYQDVAQPDQARILYENLKSFCTYGAWGVLAIKARSVDSTSKVDDVYRQESALLSQYGIEVQETVRLDPLEKDHAMAVCRVSEALK